MNAHLVKDLDKLKAQILRVAAAVEENVRKSVRALRELSAPLARTSFTATGKSTKRRSRRRRNA